MGDPIGWFVDVGKRGRGLVPFRWWAFRGFLVNGPEELAELQQSSAWPPLTRGQQLHIRKWFSRGLFVIDGEEHERERRLVWHPAVEVAPKALPEIAVRHAAAATERWQQGVEFDLLEEMWRLAYAIDWELLTGTEDAGVVDDIRAGVDALDWLMSPIGEVRWALPLPASLRVKAAKRRVDSRVRAVLDQHRRRVNANGGVLGAVAGADVSEEALVHFVKGYICADLVDSALHWTMYLLALNPDVERRLHEEVDAVLGGGRLPTAEDVDHLDYTQRVFKESMRLYPPGWGFTRKLAGDFELGGKRLGKGTLLFVSPWVMQRDPEYWPEPDRFDPDRWLPERERPREYTYLPLPPGPYGCLGWHLSMIKGPLVLATIARRWRLRLASPEQVELYGSWQLRAKPPLQVTPEAR